MKNKMDASTPTGSIPHPPMTPGYTAASLPRGSQAQPGFKPAAGEGQARARERVIDQVLRVAESNGQRPARNA